MKPSFRSIYTVVALLVGAVILALAPDPAAAAGCLLLANAPAAIEMEVLQKALSDHGVAWKAFMDRQTDAMNELKNRLLEVEQKGARHPGGGDTPADPISVVADLIVNSDHTKAYLGGHTPQTQISVPRQMFKAAIINATGQNQPLVVADRRPGIVFAPPQRLTIRDLFSSVNTAGNLIEFARETLFTNNAGPQYDGSSPGPTTEGAVKNESTITFELATAPTVTIAHWIPASRQVLADAPMLRRYLDERLLYGVKVEEEDELLNGLGTSGTLNGLLNQAATFSGGVTNATAMDTLARSVAQLWVSNYMASGFVINPMDWWSDKLRLAKDQEGRYILGDPQQDVEARLWGLPCVITNSMPAGRFLTLDARRTGYIADREDANVRISEHHADFFIRNMVAILAEERIGLVVELPSAMVAGNLSNAG